MKYSIVIPYLSNSKCIDMCKEFIAKNSMYENEIVDIVDETDVYYAYNKGVYHSKCDTVVLLNDDMIVAKDWDKFIPLYTSQSHILTGYVIEANPGQMINGPSAIKYDCGTIDNFNYQKFQDYVDNQKVPDITYNSTGWYQPMVLNQRSWMTFPNIKKHPEHANDVILIDQIMPKLGYNFDQINMFAYHFARQTITHSIKNKKRCIFTYCNYQIEDKIVTLQARVIDKLNTVFNCKFEFLRYKGKDGEMFPDQVIDYALEKLLYEDNYETILMLDIDCVPLSTEALEYMFEQAENGKLVGNIQRSNHIENNKHVYVAPSAVCFTRETFEKLGKPSFKITHRGDIGEELTYCAEDQNIPVEMFMPSKYERLPHRGDTAWKLADNMPEYGIGTTFINDKGQEMFYHLFESRTGANNDLFFLKCADILLKK
jgi:hypothetical protein